MNVLNDPGGHAEFINMPSNITLTLAPDGFQDQLSGAAPFVPVREDLDKDFLGGWTLGMGGTGTVAGHPNISVNLTGHIIDGLMYGVYTMGVGGGLPGGQPIEYRVKPKAGTPIPATPTQPTATATLCPPANSGQVQCPAPTATATPGPNLPAARSWQVNITIPNGGDPDDISDKVGMPPTRVLVGQMLVDSPSQWTFTLKSVDGTTWVDVRGGPGSEDGTVTKKQNGSWNMQLGGSGMIGGNEFDTTFTGALSADDTTLTGSYVLDGAAGTITYAIASKPGAATSTSTPTRTPTGQPQPFTPTSTRTPTGQPQPFTPTPTRTPTSGVTPIPPTPTWTRTPACSPGPGGAGSVACPGGGDANKDGAVNSIDGALVLQHTAALFDLGARETNADVDQDGYVTSIDASLILQYDARLIDVLPRPRPG